MTRAGALAKRILAFLFLVFTMPVQASVPLVQNSGFETGDFSSWTQTGPVMRFPKNMFLV